MGIASLSTIASVLGVLVFLLMIGGALMVAGVVLVRYLKTKTGVDLSDGVDAEDLAIAKQLLAERRKADREAATRERLSVALNGDAKPSTKRAA